MSIEKKLVEVESDLNDVVAYLKAEILRDKRALAQASQILKQTNQQIEQRMQVANQRDSPPPTHCFIVIKFHNYRKDKELEVLSTHLDFESADSAASEAYSHYVKENYDEDVEVKRKIEEQWIFVRNARSTYCVYDGFGHDIIQVVELE
jgi:hypothetical protein